MSSRFLAAVVAIAAIAVLAPAPAAARDFCIDPVGGSDSASGLDPACWRTLQPPAACPSPLQPGDRVHLLAGRHVHPLTAWYQFPGVSWYGDGREATTVVFNKPVAVPFVRFVTGSAGSGPPCDRRAGAFDATSRLSDLTIRNEGQGATGIEVVTSSGTSAPVLERIAVEGFPVGISFHPASEERSAPTTQPVLTQSIIRDADDTGLLSFADVFYARTVTERSQVTSVAVQSAGAGVRFRSLISYVTNFDPADAVVQPTLTNVTAVGGTESSALLASYLDDGTGERLATVEAATWGPVLAASIFTGSTRFGVEETSAFTEPATVRDSCLGGNAAGDYRDEGTTTVGAASVGTANIANPPQLVSVPAGDLHQLATSPTLDRVAPAMAAPVDVDGHSRPQGPSSDMGADEWFPCTAAADASASVLAPPCSGEPTVLDGSDSTVDAACTLGLRYEWLLAGAVVGTGPTLEVSPTVPTTWVLRVRCADPALSACFDEVDVPVNPAPAPPALDAGPDVSECFDAGAPAAVPVAVAITTDPDATVASIAWTATSGAFDDPTAPATTWRGTAPSDTAVVVATVTVVDSHGCEASVDVMLSLHGRPVPAIDAPALVCQAAGADATADLAASTPTGTGPFSWAWSASEGSVTGAETAVLTVPPGGSARDVTVTVVATDAAGCTGETSAVVRVAPDPVAEAGADSDQCLSPADPTVPLDGSGSSSAGPISVLWTSDAGTVLAPTSVTTALDLSGLSASQVVTVTLVVTDGDSGCTSTDTRRITAHPGASASPGGPYTAVQDGSGSSTLALDGTSSTGEAPLAFSWTTNLGTFVDSGTTTSSLPSPSLSVPDQPADQRGQACLTVTSAGGCSDTRCAPVAVLLEPPLPPLDPGPTLRVTKGEPGDVVLRWAEAPTDVDHDAALDYEVWVAGRGCGPFVVGQETAAVPGTNQALDAVLHAPPARRFYVIVSRNDAGRSAPLPPDGALCR